MNPLLCALHMYSWVVTEQSKSMVENVIPLSHIMPTFPNYPGLSQIQNESDLSPVEVTINLLDTDQNPENENTACFGRKFWIK